MPQIIDADAHVVEGASFARQALARWPERVKYQAGPDGKGGFTIEGRRYPEPAGPGAGCPPEHGLSDAPGIDPHTLEGMLRRRRPREDRPHGAVSEHGPRARRPCATARFAGGVLARSTTNSSPTGASAPAAACTASPSVPIEDVDDVDRGCCADAKKLGLVAALVPPALRERNLDHPDLDPFYAAAADLDMPLGVHGAPGIHLPKIGVDRFTNYIQVHCVSFPFDQMTAMTALVSGGVFDRHPRLRVAFLEAGVTWVPYFIDRLHEHWEKRGDWIPNGWQRDPREYVERGNDLGLAASPSETMLPAVVDALGAGLRHVRQRLPALGRRLPGEHARAALAHRHQRVGAAQGPRRRTRGGSTGSGRRRLGGGI